MSKNSFGVLLGIIFALGTAWLFYWLWSQYNNADTTGAVSPTTYNIVDIESVKNQGSEIIKSLEKNSDIPITVPTSKMGRTNPFVSP